MSLGLGTCTQWKRASFREKIIESGCNYVPEVRIVEWENGQNLTEDVMVARAMAAARIDQVPLDWCVKAKALSTPMEERSSFYQRSADMPADICEIDVETLAAYLYAALVLSNADASIRSSGRRSARRLWKISSTRRSRGVTLAI